MKKAGFVLAAVLLLVTSLPSFAQQADPLNSQRNESEGRLLQGRSRHEGLDAPAWLHGPVLDQRRARSAEMYLPYTWFNQGVELQGRHHLRQ